MNKKPDFIFNDKINFDKLEVLFNIAIKKLYPKSKIYFLGSTKYFGKISPQLVTDIDYCICGTSKRINFTLLYNEINKLIGPDNIAKPENSKSFIQSSYIGSVYFKKLNKKIMLHEPYIFKNKEQMIDSSYLSSLIIYLCLVDKTNKKNIDQSLLKYYPSKIIKRFLCLEFYFAEDYTLYFKLKVLLSRDKIHQGINLIRKSKRLDYYENLYEYFIKNIKQAEKLNKLVTDKIDGDKIKKFIEQHSKDITKKIKEKYPQITERLFHPRDIKTDFTEYFYRDKSSLDSPPAKALKKIPDIKNRSDFILIDINNHCPVGCAHCIYATKFSESKKCNSISQNNLTKSADFVIKAKTKTLLITGGGEPMYDLDKCLTLIKKVSKSKYLKRIEIITSGYLFTNSATSEKILSKIYQSTNNRISINIRISLDDQHAQRIPIAQFAELLKVAPIFEDRIFIYFSGLKGQNTFNRLAKICKASVQNSKKYSNSIYTFKSFTLKNKKNFYFMEKSIAYSGRALTRTNIPAQEQCTIFSDHQQLISKVYNKHNNPWSRSSVNVNPILGKEKLNGPQLYIYHTGEVGLSLGPINKKCRITLPFEKIFDCLKSNVLNFAISSKGLHYIKNIFGQIDPALYRDIEISRLFKFLHGSTIYNHPKKQLYLSVKILQDLIQNKQMSISNIPQKYQPIIKATDLEIVYWYLSTAPKTSSNLLELDETQILVLVKQKNLLLLLNDLRCKNKITNPKYIFFDKIKEKVVFEYIIKLIKISEKKGLYLSADDLPILLFNGNYAYVVNKIHRLLKNSSLITKKIIHEKIQQNIISIEMISPTTILLKSPLEYAQLKTKIFLEENNINSICQKINN